MLDQTRLVFLRRQLPQLFQADAELLRIAPVAEPEVFQKLLGQRAARTFRKQRVLAAQLHAAREAVLGLPVAPNAHIAGGDTDDGAVLVPERLDSRETRIDLDTQFCSLFAQPAHHITEADDIIAVVVHQRRHQEIRQPHLTRWTEIQEAILEDRRRYRRPLLPPIRDESIEANRIDHRTGQRMGTDFRRLFQNDN